MAASLPTESSTASIVETVFLWGAAHDRYTSQLRRAFALNAHERLALSSLWARGPMTMTELGACIPLSRAAVTTLVDRLEAAGFVGRGADPRDRRRTVVSLHDSAIRRFEPVIADWARSVVELVSHRDPQEWDVITRFFDELLDVSDRHTAVLQGLRDEEIQAMAGSVEYTTTGGAS